MEGALLDPGVKSNQESNREALVLVKDALRGGDGFLIDKKEEINEIFFDYVRSTSISPRRDDPFSSWINFMKKGSSGEEGSTSSLTQSRRALEGAIQDYYKFSFKDG